MMDVAPLYPDADAETAPASSARIVCLGGGTGMPVLLSGFNDFHRALEGPHWPAADERLTAIVAVSDDGGSSGRIIDQFSGALPPGDVRNCVLALADSRVGPLFQSFFGYRFGGTADESLRGHSAGNLMILALSQLNQGDFRKTILDLGRLFSMHGRILLPTLQPTVLGATLQDGSEVLGESSIPLRRNPSPLDRVFLRRRDEPEASVDAMPESVDAILAADVILLSPGSLYTSLLPNLLVPGIAAALRETKALRIFVCNLVTEVGETDGYSVHDHARAIERHAGFWPDVVLANGRELDEGSLRRYALDGFRQDWQVARDEIEETLASLNADGRFHTPDAGALQRLHSRIAHLNEKAKRLDGGRIGVLPEESPDDLPYRLVTDAFAEEVQILDRGVTKRVLRHDPAKVVATVYRLLAERRAASAGSAGGRG